MIIFACHMKDMQMQTLTYSNSNLNPENLNGFPFYFYTDHNAQKRDAIELLYNLK